MTCDSGIAFLVIAVLTIALVGWWTEHRNASSWERSATARGAEIDRLRQQLQEHLP